MYLIIATPLTQTQEKEFVCALFLMFVARIVNYEKHSLRKKMEADSPSASTHTIVNLHIFSHKFY